MIRVLKEEEYPFKHYVVNKYPGRKGSVVHVQKFPAEILISLDPVEKNDRPLLLYTHADTLANAA